MLCSYSAKNNDAIGLRGWSGHGLGLGLTQLETETEGQPDISPSGHIHSGHFPRAFSCPKAGR